MCCHYRVQNSFLLFWKIPYLYWALLELSNVATSQNLATPMPMCNMPRHVNKKVKECQTLGQKTYFQVCFFPFFVFYSSCPKEFKNAIKNRMPNFFLGSFFCTPYLQWISKNWHCNKLQCCENFRTFGLLSTCCWHVYDISN